MTLGQLAMAVVFCCAVACGSRTPTGTSSALSGKRVERKIAVPIVGKWSSGAMPIGGNPQGQRIRDRDRSAELYVGSNGKFSLTWGSTSSGTWTKNADTYNFRLLATADGNNPSFDGVVSNDGTTLTITGDPSHPFWVGPLTVTFSRDYKG